MIDIDVAKRHKEMDESEINRLKNELSEIRVNGYLNEIDHANEKAMIYKRFAEGLLEILKK